MRTPPALITVSHGGSAKSDQFQYRTSTLSSDRLAFGVAELARALGVTRPTVYKLMRSGELVSFPLGRPRLIARDQAEAFIRSASSSGCRAPRRARSDLPWTQTKTPRSWQAPRRHEILCMEDSARKRGWRPPRARRRLFSFVGPMVVAWRWLRASALRQPECPLGGAVMAALSITSLALMATLKSARCRPRSWAGTTWRRTTRRLSTWSKGC